MGGRRGEPAGDQVNDGGRGLQVGPVEAGAELHGQGLPFGPQGLNQPAAVVGQRDQEGPPISGVRDPLQQPSCRQVVDDPCDGARHHPQHDG
jgi:hypothetical protein